MNGIDPDAVPTVRATTGTDLPLSRPPLVFAIDNGDGTTENIWGVDIVQGRAVVYCGCRHPFDDGMWCDRRARSLRLNGRNERSNAPGALMHLTPGECLWLRWPSTRGSKALVPCYTLYLPHASWNIRLDVEERMRRASEFPEWREPHILIETCEPDDLIVSMLVMDTGATIAEINGRPVTPIGLLPFGSDSSLHVVAAQGCPQHRNDILAREEALVVRDDLDDWDEDHEDELFASMGSDEVGFARLIRMPAVVTSCNASLHRPHFPTPG